jgi:hypothetical protein
MERLRSTRPRVCRLMSSTPPQVRHRSLATMDRRLHATPRRGVATVCKATYSAVLEMDPFFADIKQTGNVPFCCAIVWYVDLFGLVTISLHKVSLLRVLTSIFQGQNRIPVYSTAKIVYPARVTNKLCLLTNMPVPGIPQFPTHPKTRQKYRSFGPEHNPERRSCTLINCQCK